MKKLISILCFFLFTVSYCQEPDTSTYDLELQQEESDNNGAESQPIAIKIIVSNTNIEHTNSKTKVDQKKELVNELQEKKLRELQEKLEEHEKYANFAIKVALVAILVAQSPQPPLLISNLWKFIW